jgi:hypothetical protein
LNSVFSKRAFLILAVLGLGGLVAQENQSTTRTRVHAAGDELLGAAKRESERAVVIESHGSNGALALP